MPTSLQDDIARHMEEAKLNVARLEACKGHKFGPLQARGHQFGVILTCENCKGTVDFIRGMEYVRGYLHGGGNPDDVIDNYTELFKG